MKGRAGSYFAIRDAFDVCPDYATDVARRREEAVALFARIHAAGMRVVLDLVPNHVARGYGSVVHPELDFGLGDDPRAFFSPRNDFFYLADPPGQALRLSRPAGWSPAGLHFDGRFAREDGAPGRPPKATGNDVTSASPSATDWYEVVKLCWGRSFVTGEEAFEPRPPVWDKFDRILAYWQEWGVDGFRADFAHWIPAAAWRWLLARVKERDPGAYVFAEAYEDLDALLDAGFDAVYHDEAYDLLKRLYQGRAGVGDVDALLRAIPEARRDRFVFYLENHDERRVASPLVREGPEDGSGFGSPDAIRQLGPVLYLCGAGPVLVHAGQELGEEGQGVVGFGGGDGRTSIFDYGSMPAVAAWVNGHAWDGGRLSPGQRALRDYHRALLALCQDPSVRGSGFYGLRFALARGGPLGGEAGSETDLLPFARFAPGSGRLVLVVANLGAKGARSGAVRIPEALAAAASLGPQLLVRKVLGGDGAIDEPPIARSRDALAREGLSILVPEQRAEVFSIE